MLLPLEKAGVLLAVFLIQTFSVQAQANHKSSPNIVIILADDLGYGDVSSYNENAAFTTPHIDQLAEQGVRFTDAHTSSSVCTPTRYGLLTGRYNWRSELKQGVLSGYSRSLLTKNRLTLADLLRKEDYRTAFIGKWHLGWNWQLEKQNKNIDKLDSRPEVDFSQPISMGPGDHGFIYSYGFSGSLDMPPYVYVENSRPTTIPKDTTVNYDEKGFWRKGLTGSDFSHTDVLPHLTEKSMQYIRKQADNQPFLLYFALPAPHTPILPTTEFIGTSNANLYGDFVLQVDGVVGQITQALEEEGILEETLIIFASDNGASPRADFEELARAGHDPSYIYRGHKADIYEGGHRIPFIAHWPEMIEEGFITDETVSTVDIMATVADIAGTSLPDDAGEDSYSFLPVLLHKNYSKPLREATVFHSISGRFALRKGPWKLILWPGSGGWSFPRTKEDLQGRPDFQLYNLEEDPGEEHNLVDQYPGKVKELKALMEKYVKEGRSTPGDPRPNDGDQQWPQLEWMDK
ncbi:Arylsulfatase A [Fodinibius sediminis]|uniref:Arylsulfatase A n=2 Tax=Fodinibius sediminis TaxID=1214077 RepID=A0A521E4K4_9BACT|nr:Arylsulfatase A [Fodinibius sediminis]